MTVLVPSTNINATTGAAMTTDRPTDRAGDRVSPARIATYSNPPSAPNPSLPRMFKLNSVSAGTAVRNGWYSCRWPVAKPMNGRMSSAAKTISMNTPPMLCTHLPTDSPMIDATTMKVRITAAETPATHELDRIQSALGPMAYDRYVVHCSPISDKLMIT